MAGSAKSARASPQAPAKREPPALASRPRSDPRLATHQTKLASSPPTRPRRSTAPHAVRALCRGPGLGERVHLGVLRRSATPTHPAGVAPAPPRLSYFEDPRRTSFRRLGQARGPGDQSCSPNLSGLGRCHVTILAHLRFGRQRNTTSDRLVQPHETTSVWAGAVSDAHSSGTAPCHGTIRPASWAARNALTISGAHCRPAPAASSATATSVGRPRRYGRSLVIAS